MGSQIIKISRDDDLYMEWSSIVEAPTWFGTRAETLEYLAGNDGNREMRPADTHESRLARADETGSSGYRPWGCTWDYYGKIYMQRGVLPRSAFAEFARRWLAAEGDTEPDVADLLEPFEDAET
jgi:hypothetical protein